jgi:hypothetical protein
MKRTGEQYRLMENHLDYGLEGKIIMGQHIIFADLSVFELIRDKDGEYPIRITVEASTKHGGKYAVENSREGITLIEKIVGANYMGVTEKLQGPLPISFGIKSHKGDFNFDIIKTPGE